ncbi:MAG: hypothetical protein M3Y84_00155 [Acidobacteriota bacterium]|nr:hypothetical protein [Acidobacteriota bacterium]
MAPYRNLLPLVLMLAAFALLFASCSPGNPDNASTTATRTVTPPATQTLSLVPRPQNILDLMKQRGDQDQARPVLKIVSPAKDAVINGPTVQVKLDLSGDLKGYMPHKDPATGKGNHIHVILDNQPYEAYYELGQPFELRNVVEGKHTLRVFPSRPWHESFKNDGVFQMVMFTVKGGGDASKPTTTNSGQIVSNNNAKATSAPSPSATPSVTPPVTPKTRPGANANTSASPALPREGKDMASSKAGDVDPAKPLLTYSRPKGEYKDADADPIMIDFWLSNAKLKGNGGEYRVRYIIDDDEARYIDKWEPIWLSGWISGKHTVRLELIDKDGKPVENGDYNTTAREITVVR